MLRSSIILRILLSLCVWSFVLIGIFKIHWNSIEIPDHISVPMNGRLLLQKDNRYIDQTSTTTDRYIAYEVMVDNRTMDYYNQLLIKDGMANLASLPHAYWSNNRNIWQQKSSTKTCGKYPEYFDLEFNNLYWQTLQTSNGTFQLFGAYYDIRKHSQIGPAVRILGMINRIAPTIKTFCQFWFDGQDEPVRTKILEYKYIWVGKWGNYKQGIYQPYLIACQIPKNYKSVVPSSVSIVEHECDKATNNLHVFYNKPKDDKKKGFAVCVKGLDFYYEDLSVRLVEWIELLNILGADKIFFYKLKIHPNVSRVLEYYQNNGKVHVTPLTLPGGQPNAPGLQHMYLTKKTTHKRQNEIIPYNDCLYKNLYLYDYIALLDIDEVIMPKNDDISWHDLMKRVLIKSKKLKPEGYHSYNARNVYFFDKYQHEHGWHTSIPKYMHMLQHTYRTKNYTKPNHYVKCFHDPEWVLTLHNHFPLACLGGPCRSYSIELDDAHLQHYRADCVKTLKKNCENFRENSIEDKAIWKFKDELIERVWKTLNTLGFFERKFDSGNR